MYSVVEGVDKLYSHDSFVYIICLHMYSAVEGVDELYSHDSGIGSAMVTQTDSEYKVIFSRKYEHDLVFLHDWEIYHDNFVKLMLIKNEVIMDVGISMCNLLMLILFF